MKKVAYLNCCIFMPNDMFFSPGSKIGRLRQTRATRIVIFKKYKLVNL